jgi:hypothetical protein
MSIYKHVGSYYYGLYFKLVDWALKRRDATMVISSSTFPESRYSNYQCVPSAQNVSIAKVVIIEQKILCVATCGLTLAYQARRLLSAQCKVRRRVVSRLMLLKTTLRVCPIC